jgi:hypothetical protein
VGIVSVDLAPRKVDRSRGQVALPWIGGVILFLVAIGVLVFVLDTGTRMNVKDLFVDPSAKAGFGPHVGLFSHLGVLTLWTGATALLGASVLGSRDERPAFQLSLGVLLAVLALDDLFMLHEELGGVFARNLLPSMDRRMLEGVVFAAYGVAWVVWLVRYRRSIRTGPAMMLVAALAMLGGSVGLDVGELLVSDWVEASEARITTVVVVEELTKLGGIVLLAGYAITVAREHLLRGDSRSLSA